VGVGITRPWSLRDPPRYPCPKFQHLTRYLQHTSIMANDYFSSGASDEEIVEAQVGSRKRRKTASEVDQSSLDVAKAPGFVSTSSRIKPKGRESLQPPSRAQPSVEIMPKSESRTGSFAAIDVAPWLVSSLASMEIKRPTGIQAACIPEILKGRDCIGGSRTGTGKTVAFTVPILQKWAEDPSGIFALIIT
jgi:ATP-dependent RNA helicase DDX49/DBP8